MSMEYLPEFVQEGTLEQHPLPLLIALILDQQLSGMLHIEAQETKYWVYFEEGFPAGVHNPKSQAFLGSVLQELNLVDSAAFNGSLMKMAETKQLQGQVLLDMKAIDEEQLDWALSLQLARKLAGLFSLGAGKFVFYEEEEMPPPTDPIRVNPYALIYNAIRNSYGPEDLKKGLGVLIGKAVKVSRVFVERGELFEFPPEDQADARLLDEFRLPQEYVRGVRSGPTAAMMMLITLLYCNMLEFEEADFAQPMPGVKTPATAKRVAVKKAAQRAAPSQASPAKPGQQAEASTISDSLRRKIEEKFEQIKTAEFWEVLEVEKEADSQRLKKAFLTLAKVYHPDRVTHSGDEEIIHRMDVIISKLNESYQTLSDPHARMAHMAKVGKKGSQSAKDGKMEPRPEEAKIQFQKAMFFFKKRDYVKAAELMRWAAEMDPADGNYLAWRHWVDYTRSEESQELKIDKAKGDLLALTKSQPDCFFAARFLVDIYKALGDKANQEKFLIRANKLRPADVDVARVAAKIEDAA
jgi:curved DNA-binding protein CbpA